jgi:hypothetical protein
MGRQKNDFQKKSFGQKVWAKSGKKELEAAHEKH